MPTAESNGIGEREDEEAPSWLTAELVCDAVGEESPPAALHVQRATGKGDNFLSTLYRVRAEWDDGHAHHLIVKGMPPGEFMQQFVEEVGFFEREVAVYEALPQLHAFEEERRGGRCPHFSPAFYACARQRTLVMADLRQRGFVMADRRRQLDLAHCTLVLEALARVHALSEAYAEAHPDFLARFPDIMFCEAQRERLNQFLPLQLRSFADQVEKWPGCEPLAEKLRGLEGRCVDKSIAVRRPVEGRRTVLTHGDCWVNNFMFKYEDGAPAEMRLVDFQLSYASHPAFDLIYFLYSSPRADVRVQYHDELLERYCDAYAVQARALGTSATPPSPDEMRREIESSIYYALMSAMTTLGIVLADPEDAPELADVTLEEVESGETKAFDKIYANARFRKAWQELLPLFDEKGILD